MPTKTIQSGAAFGSPMTCISPPKLLKMPPTHSPYTEASKTSKTTASSPSKANRSTKPTSHSLENLPVLILPSLKGSKSVLSSQNSSSILGGIDVLGDRGDEVLSLLTSNWHDKHVSKYTNALRKESMKCLCCETDLGNVHSTLNLNGKSTS